MRWCRLKIEGAKRGRKVLFAVVAVLGGILAGSAVASDCPLVPERGARLGNFCCAPSHDGGSWLVTAEWMQPAGCERYGSDNSLWLCNVNVPSLETPGRIFCGDDRTAYRDPAALYADGEFHLFFTLVETEPDGLVHSYVATSRSSDLRTWSAPRKLTPKSDRDYSSPGNAVRDGDEWVLCFQSYPRPGNRDDGKVRYGDETARLYTMRSRDLVKWSDPELLRGADGRWSCFIPLRTELQ